MDVGAVAWNNFISCFQDTANTNSRFLIITRHKGFCWKLEAVFSTRCSNFKPDEIISCNWWFIYVVYAQQQMLPPISCMHMPTQDHMRNLYILSSW